MRILIVDDDPVSRLAMSSTLKRYGECDCAENGHEGVSSFITALESGTPYDLVFMDIQMPVMDGHTALAAIREAERARAVAPGQEARAVMITCHDDVKNISQSFFKGQASCYFTKPIDLRSMVASLKQEGLLQA